MSSFGSVPFDGWGSVESVEEWVLSSEESIEFGDYLLVVVFVVSFDDDGEFSFGFFEVHEEFEEGWQNLVLSCAVEVAEEFVVGVGSFFDGFCEGFG